MKLSRIKGTTVLLIAVLGVAIAHAVVPDWWTEQNVVPGTVDQADSAVIQDNYNPALIGQAKHMAYQAYLEMETQQPGSAGPTIENMVMNFSTDPTDNYAPLLIGQLKAIAQPFYDRFSELGYDVGDITLNANGYPWGESTPIEENYKPANLGQLKYVFSFDLELFPPNLDLDGDGLSDYWEQQIIDADPNDAFVTIEDVLPNDDFDGDKLTNIIEDQAGLNPVDASSNDGDTIPDDWELFYLKTVQFDENSDSDGDGYSLVDEFQQSLNPTERETEVYYGAVAETSPGSPIWGYATSTSSFLSEYAYFSMGRGDISSDGNSFIADSSAKIPADGAYIVSAKVSDAKWIEFFSYDNPSIQALVDSGDAILIPVGTRRISGPQTLVPADANTPSEIVYFGRRKTIFLPRDGDGVEGLSTDPNVFYEGRYVCNGPGHIRALPNEKPLWAFNVLDFVPDLSISSQEIFVGTSRLWDGSILLLSTDDSLLLSDSYTSLGNGWIGGQYPSAQFIPDLNAPSKPLYIGSIAHVVPRISSNRAISSRGVISKNKLVVSASKTNLRYIQPLGSGWIENFNGFGFSMIPDQTVASQTMYLQRTYREPSTKVNTLSISDTDSDAKLGKGWILTNDTYLPDEAGTESAPIYFGFVSELGLSVYSYDHKSYNYNEGVVERNAGARLTTGVILSPYSIKTEGLKEDVYYTPLSNSSSYLNFTYSNEYSSSAAYMGQGVIRSYDRVEMDVSEPPADIYYGVVDYSYGSYRAYSRTIDPFFDDRYVKVGSGHIISQNSGDPVNILLDSEQPNENIWYGKLANRFDVPFVFRTASSFDTPPPDPRTGGSHHYISRGDNDNSELDDVNYFYTGYGVLHDVQSFTPDLTESASTIHNGEPNLLINRVTWQRVFTTDLSALDCHPTIKPCYKVTDAGWIYGLSNTQKVLEEGSEADFVHPKDPHADYDNDGLSTYDEVIIYRTNPKSGDTDEDLVPDALEIELGRDPLNYDDPSADDDNDGVSNYLEYLNGTDPNDQDGDTDNDGFSDKIEITIGSNPKDPLATPDNLDLSTQVEMSFTIGDWSGSESERYRIEVFEVDPDSGSETFVYRLSATTHGEVVDGTSNRFSVGKTYKARIYWEGTKNDKPDYDWTMLISANITMIQEDPENPGQWLSTAANESNSEAPTGAFGIITDESQILGEHSESDLKDSTVFEHEGQAVKFELLKVDLDVPKVRWANDKNDFYEELPESTVTQFGAFVLLNSDDDNYSGIPDKDDVDEKGELVSITGPNGEIAETDLLPITINPLVVNSSDIKVVLDIPLGLRIWNNKNRSDRVYGKNDNNSEGPTELDSNVANVLYLEGISTGEVMLKLNLMNLNQPILTGYELLKVTVFDIEGPTSVPALGRYEYRVVSALGEWVEPKGGFLGATEDGAENKRDVSWNHSPSWLGATGAVKYKLVDFVEWGREVDIVEIQLAANGQEGENEVRAKNPDTGWAVVGINFDNKFTDPPNGSEPLVLRSSNGGPHVFRAWLEVLSLEGPTRAGIKYRGVDRLKFGFVQKGKWEIKRSIYPGGVERISELEGMEWHLDSFLPPDDLPFIEKESYQLANSSIANRKSFYQSASNSMLPSGGFAFHYEFRRASSFSSSGFRYGIMLSDEYELNSNKPISFMLQGRFKLYLAVVTDSGDTIADERCYRLADQPLPWRFTAFGRITNDTIIPGIFDSDIHPAAGQQWGAYSFADFVVRNDGQFGDLEKIDIPSSNYYLIGKEYPELIEGSEPHEKWNTK